VLASFVLTGCSRLPTAPAEGGIKNPDFVHSAKAPMGSFSSTSALAGLSGSASIDGAVGGQLCVGRFTLVIPPGAFAGRATVSITVPDSAVVRCQLGIDPPTANHFAVPVTLRSDCSGTSAVAANQLAQLWFDPHVGAWCPVPGFAPDVPNFDVVAPLWHFSDYGVVDGRAGW
jgi:hypothetical protein